MASNHKRDIDQLFKGELEHHSSEVPTSVWGKISAELDQKELIKPVVESTSRKFSWVWLSGVAASLLLFGLIIWKVQPDKEVYLMAKNNSTREQTQSPTKKESDLPIENELLVNSDNPSISHKESPMQSISEVPATQVTGKRLAYNVEMEDVLEVRIEGIDKIEDEIDDPAKQSEDEPIQHTVDEAVAMVQARSIETANQEEPELESVIEPDILVTTMEMEEAISTPVSNSQSRERPKILSGVLNFVANNLQVGGNQIVEFSETEQGILKVDVKAVFDK